MTGAERLRAALEAALGPLALLGAQRTSGGCIHATERLSTSRGDLFVKRSDPGDPAVFAAEAAGLRALRAAGTALVVPEVVLALDATPAEPGFLVLEWLDTAQPPAPEYDERLGRGLAALHRPSASAFGFERDTYCGGTLQPNGWSGDWPAFYRDRRLAPLLAALEGEGALSAEARGAFDRLLERLPRLARTAEPPALIHGDLWSGNAVVAGGLPGLVDPAAAYACREAELGMMTLFGGFSPRVFAAYEEAWPLEAGHLERRPLYQLYHVLNHALLFGGGYLGQARRLAERLA